MSKLRLKVLLLLAASMMLAACASGTAGSKPAGTPGASDPTTIRTSPSTSIALKSLPAPTSPTSSASAAGRPAPELVDLVNADGTPFRLADLAGSPALVFFGYTHCPDVCPTTIGEFFGVFTARPDVQAVFISVDPERDTAEFLESWTQYFPENFKAVTGTPGAIRRAADQYGVKYARVETSSTVGYTMSHTADVFLIDQDGRLLWAYPFGTPAATMVEDLAHLTTG